MSMEFLDELESRVREATERIRSLKEENARLADRVATLEEQLADAVGGEGEAAWAEEREEVRSRLEALTRTLEDLLEED
jgi:FtsZ-binding cell division protein ZapB